MIQGETKSGFKYEIDERVLSDWRLTSTLTKLTKAEDEAELLNNAITAIDFVFGSNKEAFFEHIAEKNDGFMPTDIVIKEFFEVINESKELKNS